MTADSIPSYFRYWGKAEKDSNRYHSLPYHCLDVAAVGHIYLLNNPAFRIKLSDITGLDENILIQWMVLLSILHDLGKFSVSFQNLRPDLLSVLQGRSSNKSYDVRHDSLGYLGLKTIFHNSILPLFFSNSHDTDEWEYALLAVARACTGHHGVPPRMDGKNGLQILASKHFYPQDMIAIEAFIRDASAIFEQRNTETVHLSAFEMEDRLTKASWLVAGFIVLSDWIGSNREWFSFHDTPMPLLDYWRTHALPQAEKALKETGIGQLKAVAFNIRFSSLFPTFSHPTPLQHHVEDCAISDSPQLFILEDVTGSGKTEAALVLAGRMMSAGCGSGLFMGLPTMATSNAMYERMIMVYRLLYAAEETPSLVLSHAARHLSPAFMSSVSGSIDYETEGEDIETPQCSAWLADNRKKALLADVGVGTIDQALLAVLPDRFQSLRLFGLAGHILIIDEVHAYDPYMNKLLQNLLSFHAALGGSAILLSATLPVKIRQEFISAFAKGGGGNENSCARSRAYPLVTAFSPKMGLSETPIKALAARCCSVAVKLLPDQDEIERLIWEAADNGHCVCWIRNTVYDALAGYTRLIDRIDKDKIMLFHARFPMGDRLEKEQAVTATFGKKSTHEKRKGKVLIATQVVEQSLDLDFDLLISDLAPMDLLIQRAGRLHRHQRDEKGNFLLDGLDRREPPLMLIYGPEPCENAQADWYSAVFSKAAYVYPNHGCLWLTARLLQQKGVLRMPDDARELIEAAFSENDTSVPEALQRRDEQANAKWQADKSLAHINMLKLGEGYAATINQWREDMRTPIRLGEMETSVRLARWDGVALAPWYDKGDFPWDMSRVSLRASLVNAEAVHDDDPALAKAIFQMKEQLPDKGKWSVLVPLTRDEDGCWRGKALNKQNAIVILKYDPLTGVEVSKQEG